MPVPKSDRIIHKFLDILSEASQNEESAIVPDSAWDHLDDLITQLTENTKDTSQNIAVIILNWCKTYHYSDLLKALQEIRDPTDRISPRDPNPPITNRYTISKIKEAKEDRNKSPKDNSTNRD